MNVRALAPNKRYTITVDAALADRFGQHLSGQFVASFGTGDGTPRLDVETGAWVVEANRAGYAAWARNLTRIEADVAAVPEAKVGDLSAAIDWWDGEAVDLKKVGLRRARDDSGARQAESVGAGGDRARRALGDRLAGTGHLLPGAPRARGAAAPGRLRSSGDQGRAAARARAAAQLHEPGRDGEAGRTVGAHLGDAALGRAAAGGRGDHHPRRQGEDPLARHDRRGRRGGHAGSRPAAATQEGDRCGAARRLRRRQWRR